MRFPSFTSRSTGLVALTLGAGVLALPRLSFAQG